MLRFFFSLDLEEESEDDHVLLAGMLMNLKETWASVFSFSSPLLLHLPIVRGHYCEFWVFSGLGFLQTMTCSNLEPFEKVVKSGFFTPELSFS